MAGESDSIASANPASVERELKLQCNARDIGKLLHHPLIANAEPLPRMSGTLFASYFDTPEQSLRHSGVSLRVRRHQGRFVQTVKSETAVRALALNRNEWETEVDGALNLDAARQAIPEISFGPVQPVFTVTTRRHAFKVQTDHSTLEIALDRTIVNARTRKERFTEIEIELKSGEPETLFVVARELANAVPLRLTVMTKSERGYRLLQETPEKPPKAIHPVIPAGTKTMEAFHTIARETLSRIVRDEEALRSFENPEALHQMRVDIRRLRTAMSLFSKMLAGPETRTIKNDLRRYARLLGKARDLDILVDALRENVPDAPSLVDLAAVVPQRAAAYAAIARKQEEPRLKGALLRVAIWIETGAWHFADAPKVLRAREKPAEKTAKKWFRRTWKRIRREAKAIPMLSVEKRHELRKHIKTLRYGAEFFAETFITKAASRRRKSMLKHLEQLQDVLGGMNDIAMRQEILPSLATVSKKEIAAEIDRLLPKATRAARRLRAVKPFWK